MSATARSDRGQKLLTASVNGTASGGAYCELTDELASGQSSVSPMLFLLNDVVFDLDEACPATPADTRRFEKLEFDYVLELGCELFAEDPLLHRNDPERARRLAWLIAQRSPDVNAALFAAPAVACDPDLVEPRFCALPQQVMHQLQAKGRRLDAVSADRAVWNRLAA